MCAMICLICQSVLFERYHVACDWSCVSYEPPSDQEALHCQQRDFFHLCSCHGSPGSFQAKSLFDMDWGSTGINARRAHRYLSKILHLKPFRTRITQGPTLLVMCWYDRLSTSSATSIPLLPRAHPVKLVGKSGENDKGLSRFC